MSAVLIAFPTARIVRTEAQRMSGIDLVVLNRPPSKRVYPKNWTGDHQYWFEHFRDSCNETLEDAVERVEGHLRLTRVIPDETSDQRSLRMAREAFAGMSPAKCKP